MWCKQCQIETNEKICPVCKSATVEDSPTEIYWCTQCLIPVIHTATAKDKGICPLCGGSTKYLAADLRPVFPEEKILLAQILQESPQKLLNCSVWAENNRYYIDGKPRTISAKVFTEMNAAKIAAQIKNFSSEINYTAFNEMTAKFVRANESRLFFLKDEAANFVQRAAQNFPEENIVISFSGGKDSTVTADLVTKALSNPSLVQIFGDTTLEFPTTLEYAKRYRAAHPLAIFQVVRNDEQKFFKVCEDIGPPARMMRWCCSMFKTGPITRVINSLYRSQQILTFYGIRKNESLARSKYNRIESDSASIKIQQQTVASPIFFWKDIEVWLYIFAEKIDFNAAYRLGYDRVGCWCCPNNTARAQFLSKIYMPNESKIWRKFLIDFAKKIGKPDPENYVDGGKWKARQGGNGLAAASSVKLNFSNCTSEEHAKIYRLVKPFSDELIGLFVPFGKIAPELGSKILREVIVLDAASNVPILSIQPFNQDGYEFAVKIRTMNVKNHDELQRMAGYQVRKFNACRKCLKCESVCRRGAISISSENYFINPQKCVHCKMCMSSKYIDGGCMMDRYLKTK